ncbi:SDR family oxidoreductase [Aspergillus vadensis CBS 113365]|uniref:Short-chain dehydrogenase n=1 Tax=Aspergillus vadensis (strain CBS 113365 / IMI 142717 / IBT 24658) TaxID=1448311 RepID=A0A319BJ00_ASPVC|nr:short-chain dehydrogenase [Aspergillus vadensis CBS 113365]PYH71889.1 short-chain dehydrogenase [Aspergillus vadensis CBS 113365]
MVLVALITGGTSGIGLDVAQQLDVTGLWKVHIIGSNLERGKAAAASLKNTTFHQTDVTEYEQQGNTFQKIFNEEKRLDFVFANAGVAEDTVFFSKHETGIPPRPDIAGLTDINLTGAIYTSYLAMHYFRRSPEVTMGNRNLIIMSSIGGLYPCMHTPVYSATKHALVGFTRSVGKQLWNEGVKVNAICPGVVITPMITPELKAYFSEKVLITPSDVTNVILKLISQDDVTDSKGTFVSRDQLHSQAILVSGEKYYCVEMPEYFDEETQLTHQHMMG